jgi:flagellar basal-body rod protein FlgF
MAKCKKEYTAMENSIYLGLSRQMTLRTNMDIVANNIANMNTNGFRAQNVLFEEYISDPRYGDDPLSFAYDYGEYQNTDAGSQEQTGNPMDVALSGPGFMGVQMANGQIGYTRDGNFQMRADGALLTSGGDQVMGQGGPITIPAGSSEVVIDERGIISNQNGQIGQLQVVEFANVQTLKPVGNNLYTTTSPTIAATNTSVQQGYLEGANVKPVVEMTRMIEILRDFQSVQKLMETEHDRLRSAVQKLTQS